MRSTDTGPALPKAVAKRKKDSMQRVIASSIIMCVALVFVFLRDQAALGFGVALVSAGIVSVDSVKSIFS